MQRNVFFPAHGDRDAALRILRVGFCSLLFGHHQDIACFRQSGRCAQTGNAGPYHNKIKSRKDFHVFRLALHPAEIDAGASARNRARNLIKQIARALRYDGNIVSTLSIHTAGGRYAVRVQPGLLQDLSSQLRGTGLANGEMFIVTTPEIWALWRGRFLASLSASKGPPCVLFLPSGERYKKLAQIEKMAEELVRAGARRDSLLIAFGGGVVGDMAGFLASIYMRGIPYVQVPTTYLAQIDSSVGGKTGVNLRAGKNLIGSFYQPALVVADPELLATLPPRELRAGIFESVKAALLGDARLFAWLEENADAMLRGEMTALSYAIHASVRIKAKIVRADERESGQRMLLNLGHTVGHAIESATQYRALLHGEAVAWGMIAALHLATARAAIAPKDAARAGRLVHRFGPLPRFTATASRLLGLTSADKKNRANTNNFVLPVKIGKAVVATDVTADELHNAIRTMLEAVEETGA